ncbi:hypothetical protein BLA29_014014 [Euroglyphus maynei]|uniref:Uncharacterized protein n=1 Tax=Euroglyphus maynei TaxID=6958 RepID=A0A1Y3BJ45_EURMA|nr:hypothetical protein BLA29_014014 [Euroglyphus maynei]
MHQSHRATMAAMSITWCKFLRPSTKVCPSRNHTQFQNHMKYSDHIQSKCQDRSRSK